MLAVHNRYRQRGGEDAIFEAETALLERHGNVVHRLEFDNDTIPESPGPARSLRLAASTVWSSDGARRVRAALAQSRPDVVHFHNTFPLISPSAYHAVRGTSAAIVQTVQNYRLICPVATMFREGVVCEDCVGHLVPWPGVLHACYRESRPQTAAVAVMLTLHRMRKTWQRDVDLFVAATEFTRNKLVEGGLPAAKIAVKPNFIVAPRQARTSWPSDYLFVGRLSEEKGIVSMLEAWRAENTHTLRIAGTGACLPAVLEAAESAPNVVYLGQLDRDGILREMSKARALIFPSIWYEGFPVTIVEAFASGLPVIASELGAMAEVIAHQETGLLYAAGDAAGLRSAVEWANNHPDELRQMGENAHAVYAARYTPEINYDQLIGLYKRAIEAAACRLEGG